MPTTLQHSYPHLTSLSATQLITDQGQHLDLQVDPPVIVVRQCFQAVQRWRWRRLERVHPQLAASGSGRGPFMEPIWSLLKVKTVSEDWTQAHKGCLRSVAAGRQHTQQNSRGGLPTTLACLPGRRVCTECAAGRHRFRSPIACSAPVFGR